MRISLSSTVNPTLAGRGTPRLNWYTTYILTAQAVYRPDYGPDDHGSIPCRGSAGIPYPCHRPQPGPSAHIAPPTMCTGGSHPVEKAARERI
jgi:hypothetical protein